jgi:hypothetical protein
MDRRVLWICILVGSTIGGLLPSLAGQGAFSLASMLGSAAGGIAGVWAASRLAV